MESKKKTGSNMKEKTSLKKKIVKIGGILLAAVILGFMVKEFIQNWQDIRPYLENAKLGILGIAILLYAAAFLATGYNWAYLLWRMDSRLEKREYLHIHMVSALARYIPGGIWNIVGKAYMCTEKGVEKSATTASMILEYVFQILSSGLFLLFFLPVLIQEFLTPILTAGFILITILILIFLPWIVRIGIKILGKVFREDLSGMQIKNRYVYQILAQYVGVWLFTGFGLIVLVRAFENISWLQGLYLMLSYPISWVAGFLSPSPNGMGVREGVLRLLLGERYSYELLLLITLTTRIWTILGEVVAFAGFESYYHLRTKKRK